MYAIYDSSLFMSGTCKPKKKKKNNSNNINTNKENKNERERNEEIFKYAKNIILESYHLLPVYR